MLVVCVNIILVAVVAVQKFIHRSNGVGMTRKFTGSWIDASCMSRNFYRYKLEHLLFLMVISVQDSKAARKTAQKRCFQTGGSPYWKVVWSNRKMRWKGMDVYFTVSKVQGLIQ